MKCTHFALFQKQLKDPFSLCLIVAKEENDRKNAVSEILKHKNGSVSFFSPETFSKVTFFQELETLPFLTKQKIIFLENVEDLDSEEVEAISLYCQKPNPWIALVFTASRLSPQNKILKACEKQGIIYQQEEEKPWEKEKRLEMWVIEEMRKEGVEIEPQAALRLIQSVDPSLLKHEIEKLICYVGEKKKVLLQDVSLLSQFQPHETLWQLADAIFQRNTQNALIICEHLIENDGDVFLVIAGLRSQMQTAYQSLILFQEHGKGAVTKAFPYLKGGFLDKKLKIFQEYGIKRLQIAFPLLFEAEIKLKNLSCDPKLIFEILLTQLTNDALSSTKFARTS